MYSTQGDPPSSARSHQFHMPDTDSVRINTSPPSNVILERGDPCRRPEVLGVGYNPCPVCICPCWFRHTCECCCPCCIDWAGEEENSWWCCVCFAGTLCELALYVQRDNSMADTNGRWCLSQSKRCQEGKGKHEDGHFAAEGCGCGEDSYCRPLSCCACTNCADRDYTLSLEAQRNFDRCEGMFKELLRYDPHADRTKWLTADTYGGKWDIAGLSKERKLQKNKFHGEEWKNEKTKQRA